MELEFKGLKKLDSQEERELSLKLADNLRKAIEEDRFDDVHEFLDAIASRIPDARTD